MTASFADRLVSLRKAAGLSQKDAAEALGISQALLSHYERGIRECKLPFLIRLTEFFGVTADYLLGITDLRQNSDKISDENELPGDAEFGLTTVLRAVYAQSRTAKKAGQEISELFMSFYSAAVFAADAALEKSGAEAAGTGDVETRLRFSVELLSSVLNRSPAAENPGGEPAPLCVATLSAHAREELKRQLSSLDGILG
ncbi:MAG: helix-turn-helix transcriptional regulator [Clostridia bacterium]|nr:helix-turn-helix transcriptional regulator [Clostridia bacterium]